MIQKTNAIALHGVKYGETSLITYLYSLEHGRITIMVNGAFSRGKGGGKAAFFQPLSLLNIVYYPAKNNGIGKLKEVSTYEPLSTLPYNHTKRTIALFIGEVIYRTIREEEANPALYQFLESSILFLDHMERGVANLHLIFLTHLSRHLGFYPQGNCSNATPYFDFKSGHFVHNEPLHPQYMNRDDSAILSSLLSLRFDDSAAVELSRSKRKSFLNGLINYYSYHLGNFNSFNSLQVLVDVFET
jgi:DNA repair protein RecO (recombination protein O)